MSIISTRGLGVRYKMYRTRPKTLKRRLIQYVRGELVHEEFWALRNVTLEVNEGEVLGVLGANGAGKSTLCMAVAQILAPDEGEIELRGRVAPMLSLGAGFNRDMTGRENLYLGGVLMGYDMKEIREREAEIVEFAELGEFIDNPIRAYSSGMRSRLAFAIATNIDPDVLIIDETLGVGDAPFRKKCEARMKHLIDNARAIILVSHSNATIRKLCNKALWLNKGEVQAYGVVDEVVRRYEAWQETNTHVAARPRGTSRAPQAAPEQEL
jgi:ABC-type polysaccharide/polyol phosphate transport system ATPase subunit